MINELDYFEVKDQLLQKTDTILKVEQKYMQFLIEVAEIASPRIVYDFDRAREFVPFWINYPPIQRGRAPSGTSTPWSEVGETAIGANLIRAISIKDTAITYPGLPSGSDIRFVTHDALIHFDIKVTGPNDRADEVVASPNQISGDGKIWNNGVINSPVKIVGRRATMIFQPELPPFYMIEGEILLCLTYFLKAVYTVERLGYQPLAYLELICAPNGLLAFDGLNYNLTKPQLFIPGKDELNHAKKRVRVRMNPLEEIAAWRRSMVWRR